MATFDDFKQGLSDFNDYISPTHHIDQTLLGDSDFVAVKAELDYNLKDIICALLAGQGLQLPNLQNLLSFDNFVKNFSTSTILFADINSLNSSLEKIMEKKQSNYILLIGPEGDFSNKERQVILQNKNFKSFSLGSTILRSETAAIAGLVLINHYLN